MTYLCVGCTNGECKICVRYINITKEEKCECTGAYHVKNPVIGVFGDPSKMKKNVKPIKTKASKKLLEDKIQELEGKLSQLSSQVGRKKTDGERVKELFAEESETVDDIIGDLDDPGFPLTRHGSGYGGRYGRRSRYPPPPKPYGDDDELNSLDPDGSAGRQLEEIAKQHAKRTLPKGFNTDTDPRLKKYEDDYLKSLEKSSGRQTGTLPKGFGSPSPYFRIQMLMTREAKRLYKKEKCLGCGSNVKFDNRKHYILCKSCTTKLQDAKEFDSAVRLIRQMGLREKDKPKSMMKSIMLKLKLAEEHKIE